jgi:hypothetical protein
MNDFEDCIHLIEQGGRMDGSWEQQNKFLLLKKILENSYVSERWVET